MRLRRWLIALGMAAALTIGSAAPALAAAPIHDHPPMPIRPVQSPPAETPPSTPPGEMNGNTHRPSA